MTRKDKALKEADKLTEGFDKLYPEVFGDNIIFGKIMCLIAYQAEKLDKAYLDDMFPRYYAKKDPRSKGKRIRVHKALENQMLAAALILNNWLGWVFESKAIMHFEKTSPKSRRTLQRYIIPMLSESMGIGIERGMRQKGVLTSKHKNQCPKCDSKNIEKLKKCKHCKECGNQFP